MVRHLRSRGHHFQIIDDGGMFLEGDIDTQVDKAAEAPESSRRWLHLGVNTAAEGQLDVSHWIRFSSIRGRQESQTTWFQGGVSVGSRHGDQSRALLDELMQAVEDFTEPMTRAQINSETPVITPKRVSENEREKEIATTSARSGARWGALAGVFSGLAGGLGGAVITKLLGG